MNLSQLRRVFEHPEFEGIEEFLEELTAEELGLVHRAIRHQLDERVRLDQRLAKAPLRE